MTPEQIACLQQGLSTNSTPQAPVQADRNAYRCSILIELRYGSQFSWHAIAWVADAAGEPVRINRLADYQRVELRRTVTQALAGVGVDPGEWVAGRADIHLWKQLSKADVARLGKDA